MPPTICIPAAQGVPGAPGPPDWWATGGPPEIVELRKLRDDPRWRGATRIGVPGTGAGVGSLCTIRALRSGADLYLAFHVYPAPEVNTSFDRVWLAYHVGGQAAQMVRIPVGDDSGPFEPKPVGSGVVWYESPASPFGPLNFAEQAGSPPAWVAATARAWVRAGEWALHVRLPLPDGARIAALVQDGWTTPGTIVPYVFPPAVDLLNAPNSNQWSPVGPAGGCPGVSLELFHLDQNNQPVFHVGTSNTPSSRIDGGQANTFFAMPSNRTGNPLALHSVKARFRIANWGSVVQQGGVSAGPWAQIIPDPNTTEPLPDNPASIPDISGGGAPSVSITGSWTAPTIPANTSSHQCVLVTLEGAHTFTQDSVYRNMDIVGASRFERAAEISVAGLVPTGDPRRTVYLYVAAEHMPARVEPEREPRATVVARDRRFAEGDGDGDGEFPPEDPVTLDEYARSRPSYRVYVFHETGMRWQHGNEDAALLEPQSAFGFLVDHAGPLYGWEHRLRGRGLKRIAPNLYRLRIPEGGTATVVTSIVAHERKPAWWRNCLLWVLAILASIGALIRRLLGR